MTVLALIAKLAAVLLRHGNRFVLVACDGPGPTYVAKVDAGETWRNGRVQVVVHDGRWGV